MSEFVLGVAAVIVGEVILAITVVIWKADWRRRAWNKARFGTCVCGYPMTLFWRICRPTSSLSEISSVLRFFA